MLLFDLREFLSSAMFDFSRRAAHTGQALN
jgi:hypothetical protein